MRRTNQGHCALYSPSQISLQPEVPKGHHSHRPGNPPLHVVYCHNNLSIDHFLEGKEKYFISWDNYRVDTPILDIINLYKNDYNKYDFRVFLDAYMKRFELNDTEKKLLFIVISMPDIKYFTQNEVDNTIIAGKFIDYIDKTEKLIRPYYAVEKKE